MDTLYVNGFWLSGAAFADEPRRVCDGLFVPLETAGKPTVVDLAGAYVVPPLADAHSHFPDRDFQWANHAFQQKGILYALNANSAPHHGAVARSLCFAPSSVDATFALAGFTCHGGHPTRVYERLISQGIYSAADRGRFFYEVEDGGEVEAIWPAFLQTKPDLVKIFLLNAGSEDGREEAGLSEASAARVLKLAKEARLRVAAHIETARDFHFCVASGVDIVMHLPGYRRMLSSRVQDYLLTPETACAAAAAKTAVVTTAALLRLGRDPEMSDVQRSNLRLLLRAGVRLALGSDREPGQGLQRELKHLLDLDVFTPEEMVSIACRHTAQTIFPERPVGTLDVGCEASFATLSHNPFECPEALLQVSSLVKAGRSLWHA